MKRNLFMVCLLLVIIVPSCTGTYMVMQYNYPQDYQLAQKQYPGTVQPQPAGLSLFQQTYAELTAPQLEERIQQLYADSFYFNDTFKSIYTKQELVAYLKETGERLESSQVEVQQVISDGADHFVRWHMVLDFTAAGRGVHSTSIGMTHLRFDANGQIVLHQDFWDGAHGFYRHLPMIGRLLEWVRNRL